MSESLQFAVEDNVARATSNPYSPWMTKNGSYPPCNSYGFLAWTSGLPFTKLSSNQYDNASYTFESPTFKEMEMPMRLYLAAWPKMIEMVSSTSVFAPLVAPGCEAKWNEFSSMLKESTMLECHLVDSTYHVSFDFQDGGQNVAITTANTNQTALDSIPNFSAGDIACGPVTSTGDYTHQCT